jgi:hypothetical protein
VKTIAIRHLLTASKSEPELWHRAFREGLSKDGVNVEVPDDFPLELPSTLAIAGNAVSALGRIAGAILKSRPLLVPDDVQKARQAVCESCAHFEAGRCRLCGCCSAGQIVSKTRLATETCPAGKWVG